MNSVKTGTEGAILTSGCGWISTSAFFNTTFGCNLLQQTCAKHCSVSVCCMKSLQAETYFPYGHKKITFTCVLYSCVTFRLKRMALWSLSWTATLTGLFKSSVCFSHKATIFSRHIAVSAVNLLKIQVCIKSEKNNRYFMWRPAYFIHTRVG